MVIPAMIGVYYVREPEKPEPFVLVTDHKAETVSEPVPQQSFRGLPVRLRIPAIGVDTPVEYLGNTPEGAMAAPESHLATGWYKYGAIPGEAGSSVIGGHVAGPNGEPGVFSRLNELSEGNTLQIIDAKGETVSLMVRKVRTYDESQQHAEVFNRTGGIYLNLVTCAGEWDADKREYRQRLVVFAEK